MSERQGSVEPLRGLLAPIRAGLNTAARDDILVGDVGARIRRRLQQIRRDVAAGFAEAPPRC